jgi:hypothetical protein
MNKTSRWEVEREVPLEFFNFFSRKKRENLKDNNKAFSGFEGQTCPDLYFFEI